MRHRRSVSAGFAFLAVLLGLAAVTGGPEAPALVRGDTPGASARVAEGQVEVPIRLADPAVVGVVTPGDVVDVIASLHGTSATLVAEGVTVTGVPSSAADGPWSSGDGLVMVAADEEDVLALAGAAARGPVTIVIHS